MASYANGEAYKVLRGWGIGKESYLWSILATRTALEVQADLETMVHYFGMKRSFRGGRWRWIPTDLQLFNLGLAFLYGLCSENETSS